MKRKAWLGIALLTLLAVTVTPVMAAGGQNQIRWRGNVFALVGEVIALDAEAKTMTVEVYTGNRLVNDYIGQELTITTDEDTQVLRFGELKCEVIAFEDVEVGSYVSANGKVVAGAEGSNTFLAKRVTVDVPLHTQE